MLVMLNLNNCIITPEALQGGIDFCMRYLQKSIPPGRFYRGDGFLQNMVTIKNRLKPFFLEISLNEYSGVRVTASRILH